VADATLREVATEVFLDPHRLEPKLLEDFEEALLRCFEKARPEVMTRYFGNRKPTREECNELIDKDSQGEPIKDRHGQPREPIKRAMQMGNEVEAEALRCLRGETALLNRLSEQKYAFSTHPTYQRNPSTGRVEHLPYKMVRSMRRKDLIGSIEPDVVVHPSGSPNIIQAVFDIKFSCVGRDPEWSTYKEGPHAGRPQGDVYEEFLRVLPIIIPH
jgi:hypothetical protein